MGPIGVDLPQSLRWLWAGGGVQGQSRDDTASVFVNELALSGPNSGVGRSRGAGGTAGAERGCPT